MLDLTNIEVIKYLCNKYGFKFSKDMGQNFLTDSGVIDVISAAAAEGVDGVIEIGPGKTLTNMIKKINAEVKAVSVTEYLAEVEEC